MTGQERRWDRAGQEGASLAIVPPHGLKPGEFNYHPSSHTPVEDDWPKGTTLRSRNTCPPALHRPGLLLHFGLAAGHGLDTIP